MSALGQSLSEPASACLKSQQRKSPGFFILRASYRNRGAQLALIFEAPAALGRSAGLGASPMVTRFTSLPADPRGFAHPFCTAYAWPSPGATYVVSPTLFTASLPPLRA